MKAPYFKLEQKEEDEILSKIILSDITPRRYTRCRSRVRHRSMLGVMSDSFTRSFFEKEENKVFNYDELFVLFGKRHKVGCGNKEALQNFIRA